MKHDSVERYREELNLASRRLYGLKEEFGELGVPPDTGKQILDRLESEINVLDARISKAEREGSMASLTSIDYGRACNQLIMDFELLELQLSDARARKKEKA